MNKNTLKADNKTETKMTIHIPYRQSSKSLGTFIPYTLAINISIKSILSFIKIKKSLKHTFKAFH